MGTRTRSLILLFVFAPAVLRAHIHKADAAASTSGGPGSFLVGPHVSFSHVLWDWKNSSVVGELGNYFALNDDDDATRLTYLVGIRRHWYFDRPAQPFVHVLGGFVRRGTRAAADTRGTSGFGVGVDWFGAAERLGARFQGDVLFQSRGDRFYRFSIGVVYRFHEEDATTPPAAGGVRRR